MLEWKRFIGVGRRMLGGCWRSWSIMGGIWRCIRRGRRCCMRRWRGLLYEGDVSGKVRCWSSWVSDEVGSEAGVTAKRGLVDVVMIMILYIRSDVADEQISMNWTSCLSSTNLYSVNYSVKSSLQSSRRRSLHCSHASCEGHQLRELQLASVSTERTRLCVGLCATSTMYLRGSRGYSMTSE